MIDILKKYISNHSVPLSCIVGSFFALLWLTVLHVPDPNIIPGYSFAVLSTTISVIIEMFSESIFNFTITHGYLRLRLIAEGGALLTRCLLLAFFVRDYAEYSLYIFGIAMIISAIFYTLLLWGFLIIDGFEEVSDSKSALTDFIPYATDSTSDVPLFSLSISFLKQTGVKQLLTEGEKFVMTFFNPLTFAEQGVFDLVSNLGALAARFVLQPIEESAFMVFSQFIDREQAPLKQKQQSLRGCTNAYANVLKLNSLVGLTVVAFGFNYSELALKMYAGSTFSNGIGPTLLRWQCLYTLVIAVNGITECFTFAAMNKRELDSFNKVLLYLSVLFLTCAYFLTKTLGAAGFIIANCVNMTSRIIYRSATIVPNIILTFFFYLVYVLQKFISKALVSETQHQSPFQITQR